MITEEICGHLCGIAESCQDSSYELDDMFVIIKNWNDGRPLRASWRIILQGFHCYGTDRIPPFISDDWNRAVRMYKKLKDL